MFHEPILKSLQFLTDSVIKLPQWALTMGISHELAQTSLKESRSFSSVNPFVSWSPSGPTESPGSFLLLMHLKEDLLLALMPLDICPSKPYCPVLWFYVQSVSIYGHLGGIRFQLSEGDFLFPLTSLAFPFHCTNFFLLCLKLFLTPVLALHVLPVWWC